MKCVHPEVEELVLIKNEHGISYARLTRGIEGSYLVLNVMFVMGLRLTANLYSGQSTKTIGEKIRSEGHKYRPYSFHEFEKPLEIVIDIAVKTLSDQNGNIINYKFESEIKYGSEENLRIAQRQLAFLNWFKQNRFRERFAYEVIISVIQSLYEPIKK